MDAVAEAESVLQETPAFTGDPVTEVPATETPILITTEVLIAMVEGKTDRADIKTFYECEVAKGLPEPDRKALHKASTARRQVLREQERESIEAAEAACLEARKQEAAARVVATKPGDFYMRRRDDA